MSVSSIPGPVMHVEDNEGSCCLLNSACQADIRLFCRHEQELRDSECVSECKLWKRLAGLKRHAAHLGYMYVLDLAPSERVPDNSLE